MEKTLKMKTAVKVVLFSLALLFSILPAKASSDLVLENAKITKVSGDTITAKLNGKKYYIDTSDANFFRYDGKKASLDEMKKNDHIDVRGEKDNSKDISADSVTNLSIWKLEDPLRGKIRKIDKTKKIIKISTSSHGTVEVYVSDDTTIRSKSGSTKKLTYLHKNYKIDVKGLFDGARKVVYETTSVNVVSR
ncbi:MAG: hypothetical protein WC831_01105 [Parcubacteria group bacterium]|jgi:hypothetical protein